MCAPTAGDAPFTAEQLTTIGPAMRNPRLSGYRLIFLAEVLRGLSCEEMPSIANVSGLATRRAETSSAESASNPSQHHHLPFGRGGFSGAAIGRAGAKGLFSGVSAPTATTTTNTPLP